MRCVTISDCWGLQQAFISHQDFEKNCQSVFKITVESHIFIQSIHWIFKYLSQKNRVSSLLEQLKVEYETSKNKITAQYKESSHGFFKPNHKNASTTASSYSL